VYSYLFWLNTLPSIESEDYINDQVDDVFIEKQNKKAYEVDFTVLSAANLKSKQDKEISQVSTILGNIKLESIPHP
jgi:hypothetical protein